MTPEWPARFHCVYCYGLKAKADIIMVDDKPICRHGNCKEKYYETVRPRVRRFTAADDGHC